MGKHFSKNATFSTIVKWHFYRLKNLLLRKKHHQKTKPRSHLNSLRPGSALWEKGEKNRPWRKKKLASDITRISSFADIFPIWPRFSHFSLSAEPGPRLRLNNSTLAEIFGMPDRSHGLTSLEKFKFFDDDKMTFLSSKTPPFEKTTSSNENA